MLLESQGAVKESFCIFRVLLALLDMYVKVAVVVLVLIVQRRVDASESADIYDTSSQERPLHAQKRRLSLQDTGKTN